MAFQTPISIETALRRIHRHEYALPAIQRDFVWTTDQICALFDSVMQEYPIGAFLFWKIQPERVKEFKYYDFIKDYHQRDRFRCPQLDIANPEAGLTGVLDGQQRLTAINIGLRGSYAYKLSRYRVTSDHAYPTRYLHVNLLHSHAEGNAELRYDFRFLTREQAHVKDTIHYWFKVGDILDFRNSRDIHRYLMSVDLADREEPFDILDQLHESIFRSQPIVFFEESSQDLHKVLNVFIRTNSGGTQLSYSDMLLSIATAQWETMDARNEINGLVDELNGIGDGFNITKDFVLKCALLLAEINDIRFQVTNFNYQNMAKIEEEWTKIRSSIVAAVNIASQFGFSSINLRAYYVLAPIAYWIHRRGLSSRTMERKDFGSDRKRIRDWMIRALLKRGVWGGSPDSVLTGLRNAIKQSDDNRFPDRAINASLSRMGRGLSFDLEELEDLVDSSYSDPRTFGLLTLLYPFVDVGSNRFHVDHVFPTGQMTRSRLKTLNLVEETVSDYIDKMNRLPNLQLLVGLRNQEKAAKLPSLWLQEAFDSDEARQTHTATHDLGTVPENQTQFGEFYEARRKRMMTKLCQILDVNLDAVPR